MTKKNILVGSTSNDTLNGGDGQDTLTGGDGSDTFTFDFVLPKTLLKSGSERDTITDFSVGGDIIQLMVSSFSGLTAGTLPHALTSTEFKSVNVSSLASAIKSGDIGSSDRIIYNQKNGTLYYDADGSGSGFFAIEIAILTGKPSLTEANILIG